MIIFNITSSWLCLDVSWCIIKNYHSFEWTEDRATVFFSRDFFEFQFITVKWKSIISIQISGGIKDLQIENKKRKNSSRAGRGTSSHRTESEVDSHDSSSISTLDQAVKQWMVAAAKGKFLILAGFFFSASFSVKSLHQRFRVGSKWQSWLIFNEQSWSSCQAIMDGSSCSQG